MNIKSSMIFDHNGQAVIEYILLSVTALIAATIAIRFVSNLLAKKPNYI